MAGLEQPGGSNTIFLSVVDGQLARRFEKHQQNEKGEQITKERVIKNRTTGQERTVIEAYYGGVEGLIEKSEIHEGKYGFELRITINAGEHGVYQIQMPYNSGYTLSYLMKVPNIDPDSEVIFRPYSFTPQDKDKKISGVTIIQKNRGFEDDKVPNFWTKEDPKGLPEGKKSEDEHGKIKWDFKDRNRHLNKFHKEWADKLGALNIASSPSESLPPEPEHAEVEEEDDLPFS